MRWIDPNSSGECWWLRHDANKAFGVGGVGAGKNHAALLTDCSGMSVMD